VFTGNAIDGGSFDHAFKWGIAVHASHYGQVLRNTVYNYAGSGIATEDGSETGNVFDLNFVARTAAFGPLDVNDRGTAGTALLQILVTQASVSMLIVLAKLKYQANREAPIALL